MSQIAWPDGKKSTFDFGHRIIELDNFFFYFLM